MPPQRVQAKGLDIFIFQSADCDQQKFPLKPRLGHLKGGCELSKIITEDKTF